MKGGGGVGNFQLARIFFSLTACAGIFFSGEPLCTNFFFQTNIAFFLTVKSWFITYVFVLYKLFYTHKRSKDTSHFNAKSFQKYSHSERGGSHLEWTASLCICETWPWESAWTVVLFPFFSRAKFTSTTQCKTCGILNFDWVNLVFSALSLIFRGHEDSLLHAYWVIISCGLCFCRCPW